MTLWITLTICCILTASASAQFNEDDNTTADSTLESSLVFTLSSKCEDVRGLFTTTPPNLSKLTFNYITPNNTITYNLSSLPNVTSEPWYKKGKPLILFSHGFTDKPTGNCASAVNQAIQNFTDVNILLLNAYDYIGRNYLRSTIMVRFIGERVGSAAANMTKAGFNASLFHLAGHSLGAHIMGFASKRLYNLTGLKPGRTTGLDPAGPCFTDVSPAYRINATDAKYVDIIHTNAGVFGLDFNLGHSDYWPNNGTSQPGCSVDDVCSHGRVCLLFAESVANNTGFPAVDCNTTSDFERGTCSDNDISSMGYFSQPDTVGRYYLKTASKSPYALGASGIK